MKMTASLNKYCPKCRKYEEHSVSIYKKGKDRKIAQGARRLSRKTKGYGSFPKPIQKRPAKTTKKTMFRLKCKACGYIIQTKGIRLKRVEVERG